MNNPHLFTSRNKILQYMSASTQIALNKINEQNHNIALGAKEGVPNEDATWEYETNCSIQNYNCLRTSNIEWRGFFMSPIKQFPNKTICK